MNHYGSSDIQNVSIFAFNNSILLGCMRIRGLMNNPIFETKNRCIFFNLLQGVVSTKHRIEIKTDFLFH